MWNHKPLSRVRAFEWAAGAALSSAVASSVLLTGVLLVGCGGEQKPAQTPGCPAGLVLRGNDCVPPEAAETASKEQSSGEESSESTAESSSDEGDGKTPYDKEATEAVLARAARQVNENCGAATDEDGKATGPWGKTKISVTLGRNGHTAAVTVPKEFEGQPAGNCIIKGFSNLTFPPYAHSSDVTVEWEVELTEPPAKQNPKTKKR